jgi:hypothetical protein
MRAGTAVLLLLAACVTPSAGGSGLEPVLAEPPVEGCQSLGPVAVRMSTELMMPDDARLASAVNELRRRAVLRGATHLVVARPSSPALVAYGTTAAASGVAYRCPSQR